MILPEEPQLAAPLGPGIDPELFNDMARSRWESSRPRGKWREDPYHPLSRRLSPGGDGHCVAGGLTILASARTPGKRQPEDWQRGNGARWHGLTARKER